MMVRTVLVLLLAAVCAADLVNEQVTRAIDLTTHLSTYTVDVTVKNTGSSTASSYTFVSDKDLADNLSFLSATSDGKTLSVSGSSISVTISAGQSAKLSITAVYTNAQEPFPARITQKDRQLVRFAGNVYYTSVYATKTQTTTVNLAGAPESFTKSEKPVSNDKNKITFGPYKDVAANHAKDLSVHFENNTPFLNAASVVREIEISHWGYVSVTEYVKLVHTGAALEGSFSRLDFQRDPRAKQTAVTTFTSLLPAAATDVYYRDVIGNISTSNLREEDDQVVFEARPRFPLFGGWKTEYTVGYTLPAAEVLTHDGSSFTLSARFVDHLYSNQVVDHAVVKVILPEGASDVSSQFPYSVTTLPQENRVTYLDTFGRTVLVFSKDNLVKQHMKDFTVSYTFHTITLFREPAMVVLLCLAVFLVFITLNHIDFSIGGGSAPASAEKKTQ